MVSLRTGRWLYVTVMKPTCIAKPGERLGLLTAERNRKMAASAHAYVRGSTTRFYQWLEDSDRSAVPDGPQVWICGDCHVGNLGPAASTDGALAIQVRDLDQTVIGNPAHDIIRLSLSLAMAARGSDLPGVTTACMLERVIDGYQAAFAPEAQEETGDASSDMPKIVRMLMREAAGRKRWLTELRRNRSKSLDAPSWLWTSVVDLIGAHEVAYLEHCRRYARRDA